MQKLLTFFFSKNISIYAIFNDQSFNNILTNDISFEQLGPGINHQRKKNCNRGTTLNGQVGKSGVGEWVGEA